MIEKIIIVIIVVAAGLAVAKKIYVLACGKEDSCSSCCQKNCSKKEKIDKK